MCLSESALRVMLLNCRCTGEIFSQLAKEQMISYCSSSERSIKLIGSISRILIYRPSVVSIMPCSRFLIGMKSWVKLSFSGFLFPVFLFAELSLVIFVSHPSQMQFSSVRQIADNVTRILEQ